ncbi:MAG TPA: arginine--tRNA ligase [Aquificaceae bacterium]|nr:arginine--tRNA ligase [Aquificaceae bacterium]
MSNGKSKYIHYGYGLVMLSKDTAKLFGIEDKEVVRMSGRKGIYINVDNLLEKAIEIAKKKIAERHTNMPKKELETLAFKIARSTISFEILKYDRNKTVVFDLERMTNIEEGNALYLMYTYARIRSLLEKSGIKDFEKYAKGIEDLNDYERKLLKVMFLFKDIILETSSNLELNLLAEYSLKLARTFNEFYQNVPILPELDKKPYRIFLAYLTKQILEKLFYILKIDEVSKI